MIPVRMRIIGPTGTRSLSGSMTFTPRSSSPGRTITDDGALISGSPIPVKVEGEQTVKELRPTPPGWHYQVTGKDETGYRWSEAVYVPSRLDFGQESIDYGDLVRADPKALTTYTPDPEWWRIVTDLIRIIEGAGGVPGESAKTTVERVLGRDLTDVEFQEALRGARGYPGDDGEDGETYLDYFRQEVGNPNATRDEYHDWIRGRDFLEQWAKFHGVDADEAEMSEALASLHGRDSFDEWKLREQRPSATWAEYVQFFTGPKGADSTVEGPEGKEGRSALASVQASNPEITEHDFVGSLMGIDESWVLAEPLNGWSHSNTDPLRVRMLDGRVDLVGHLTGSGDTNGNIFRIPSEMALSSGFPRVVQTTRFGTEAVRIWIAPSGTVSIQSTYAGGSFTQMFIETSWAAPGKSYRPRVPGPAGRDGLNGSIGKDGKSAYELARQDGWDGTQEHFVQVLGALARFTPDQLKDFLELAERAEGPQGPRGRDRGAHEAILDLAREDGWTAVYDPTNTDSLTTNGAGEVIEMRDGLGNLPPLKPDGAGPRAIRGEYGQLSGLQGGTLYGDFSEDRPMPLAMVNVARSGKGGADSEVLVSGELGRRMEIYAEGGRWRYSAGLWRAGKRADTAPHVLESVFNNRQSSFKIDGQTSLRGLHGGSLLQGTLRLGGRQSSSPWLGSYGLTLIYRGDPPQGVLNRMRALLLSLTGIQPALPEFNPETRVLSVDGSDTPLLTVGDPDALLNESIASMTKMITCLIVRHYVPTNEIDDLIEVTAQDAFRNAPFMNFQAGDMVSWRNLMHAIAKVSDNDVASTFARHIYERFLPAAPAGVTYYQAFLNEADRLLNQVWGMRGALMRQATGGARLSTRQVAKVMRMILADPVLRDCFGPGSVTFWTQGSNPREITFNHTFSSEYSGDFIAKKTGGGGVRQHICVAWRAPDGTEHITVIQDVFREAMQENESREPQFQRAQDHVLSGFTHADRGNSFLSGSPSRTTHIRDITHFFSGTSKTDAYMSGIFIVRTDSSVTLTFRSVRMRANFSQDSVIPPGFRPSLDYFDDIKTEVAQVNRRVQIRPGGTIFIRGNTADDVLSGGITWLTHAEIDSDFPQPPFPGYSLQADHASYWSFT